MKDRGQEKAQRRDGTGGESYLLVLVMAVVFPAVTLVAGVTYGLLRRRWPDRGLAWLLAVAGAPVLVVLVLVTRYQERWWAVVRALVAGETPAAGDLAVLAGWGAAAGPILGAGYWWARQRRRERSPYSGQDERERRQRAEERRLRATAHRVQAARHTARTRAMRAVVRPFMVPLGDELGPFVGRGGRGDLGREWAHRGLVRVPLGTSVLRHLVVLGGSGLGKTETILGPLAEWAIEHDLQLVYLSCKEPPSAEEAAAPRLAAMAERYGRTLKVLVAGSSPFDPMRGSPQEVRDRLVKIEEWGDRYWQHCANLLVGLALELSQAQGKPISTLPTLVYSLVSTRLKELAKDSGDRRVRELVDALEDRALSGALMRYASMAIHLREWVGPPAAGGWSYEDADVICAELPTGTRPEAAAALLRLMVRDFGSYLVSDRRQRTAAGGRRGVVFIVEEVGAVAGDPVIGGEFVNLVERARSAGAKCILSAQDPLGLGDERAMSAILSNGSVLTFRQGPQAEKVAQEAGTKRVDEGAALFDQAGDVTAQGSTRRQHAMKVNPQWLRELGPGEAYVIHGGEFRYLAATMSAAGYATATSPAAVAMVEQLRAARAVEADELGEPIQGGPVALPGPRTEVAVDDVEDQGVEPKPRRWSQDER